MAHKRKVLAEGMKFVRSYPDLFTFIQLRFDEPIRIEKVLQNEYTGAETTLVSNKLKNRWYLVFSSGDVARYGSDEKGARSEFMHMGKTEGELL
jgi:hypothetical protein